MAPESQNASSDLDFLVPISGVLNTWLHFVPLGALGFPGPEIGCQINGGICSIHLLEGKMV